MKFFILLISASLFAQSWAQSCRRCSPDSVNVNTKNHSDPLSSNPTVDYDRNSGGCSTLTVTCTPTSADTALMTFQNNLGGPAPANPVAAALNCSTEGQWMFSQNGESTPITAVYCYG